MRSGFIGSSRFVGLALIALFAIAAPACARAWDVEASRVVGLLTYQRLTPAARAKVDAILGAAGAVDGGCRARSLADAADFAACLHGRRDDFMRDVAYEAISICTAQPQTQGCRDGGCAGAALKREIAALSDPNTGPDARAVALEAVVYLIGELHQPLHAADNGDHSGVRMRVTLPGSSDRRLNLYGVWDEDLVAIAIGDAETGLPYLAPLADAHAADWSQGGVDDWLADSHRVAVTDVYGRLPVPPPCGHPPDKPEALDRAYIDYGAGVVRTQLAKAAVRAATVLNAALK